MFSHLGEDYRTYREGLLAQGFWALQIHRFGMARKRVPWRIVRYPWAALHVVLSKVSQILFGIYIGPNAVVGRRFTIEHFGGIIIHSKVTIGDDVTVRQGVTIGNRHLDRPNDVPVIGNRVNVGAGAKVLGGIVIGDDVSIGANAVVLKDVPSGCVAIGVPAVIRQRTPIPAAVFETPVTVTETGIDAAS
ncbi:serine O-acetyltransferase [Aureimonas psammosilenae]|uniref:serine O-acetyltransferase n=1 Tax=Aureimonas psammosilenae TaxID=2495496 RepID=UPI001F44732C|nr:serine O-acetyltransferase [Aureimonas psammosilenae]